MFRLLGDHFPGSTGGFRHVFELGKTVSDVNHALCVVDVTAGFKRKTGDDRREHVRETGERRFTHNVASAPGAEPIGDVVVAGRGAKHVFALCDMDVRRRPKRIGYKRLRGPSPAAVTMTVPLNNRFSLERKLDSAAKTGCGSCRSHGKVLPDERYVTTASLPAQFDRINCMRMERKVI